VLLQLLGDDVPPGDLPLVVLEIARQLDDLHPVLQRSGIA